MKRRGFLASLAALPFIKKAAPAAVRDGQWDVVGDWSHWPLATSRQMFVLAGSRRSPHGPTPTHSSITSALADARRGDTIVLLPHYDE